MPTFDIEAARKDGLPDDQILQYLGKAKGFDVDSAVREGANKEQLLNYLSVNNKPTDKQAIRGHGATDTWEEKPSTLRQTGNIIKDIGASITNPEVGGSIVKAALNVPKSGMNYVRNIASAVIPKKESYYVPGGEIARGLGSLAIGGVEKLIPGEQGKEPYADAVGQFYKNRYGGGENVKNTFINDPVGFAADVSTLLSLGGTGASAAGRLLKPATKSAAMMPAVANIPPGSPAKLSTLEKIGSEMSQVGKAIEPTNLAIKAITPPIKIAGSIASQMWGRLLHGAGSEANVAALKGNPDFINVMRGNISKEEVLGNVKDGLNQMNLERSYNYQQQMDKLPNIKPIDITPIRSRFIDMLNKFKIKYDVNKGKLDFSRSRIIKNADQSDLNEIFNVVKDWGSKPDDLLPKNVDTLKQILGEYYSDNSNIRAIVAATYSKARRTLIDNVPGYEKMVGDYETSTRTTKEIERALSLGNKAMADTAIRKLMSTMRDSFTFRKDLLNKVEEATGKDLSSQIAGLSMQSFAPRGLIGGGLDVGLISQMIYAHKFSPMLAVVLLSSSPRISGEFLYYLGRSLNAVKKTGQNKYISNPAMRQTAYQAGRISNIENEPDALIYKENSFK
mgnify:CR=1 FL=1